MTLSMDPKIDYTKPCATRFCRKTKPKDIQESNVLVGLSTSQDYHNGNSLLSIIDYIASESFNTTKFLPAGILERYNLAIENGSIPEAMKEEARKFDNQWRKNNRKALKKIPKENIYDWEIILASPNYKEERNLLQTNYNNNEHFHNSVLKDAQAYLNRRKIKSANPSCYETKEALEYAVDYKLEELTVFKILAEKEQFGYFAYPGKCPAAVNALFTDILNPCIKTHKIKSNENGQKILLKWFGLEIYTPAEKLQIQTSNSFNFFGPRTRKSPTISISEKDFHNILKKLFFYTLNHGSTEEVSEIAKALAIPNNTYTLTELKESEEQKTLMRKNY